MAVAISCLSGAEAFALLPQLTELLHDVVESGASVGFLPPLAAAEAEAYWQGIAADVATGTRVLLAARASSNGPVLASGQLDLAVRPNSLHRAEVSKLLVHTRARRQGLGRQMLQGLEAEARRRGRSTLVLDTRAGDVAELLYQQQGYQRVGLIPEYFVNHDGRLHATAVYYKLLNSTQG